MRFPNPLVHGVIMLVDTASLLSLPLEPKCRWDRSSSAETSLLTVVARGTPSPTSIERASLS